MTRRRSLRTIVAARRTEPHHVLRELRSRWDEDISEVYEVVLPYALEHRELFDLFDSDSPLVGILLRLYDLVHHHDQPDRETVSDMVHGLEVDLVLGSDPEQIGQAVQIILGWSTTRVRHRDVLSTILVDILYRIFPGFDDEILQEHKDIRSLYKTLYKKIITRTDPNDRAILLASLYERHDWDAVIGEMIASCIRSDPSLRSDTNARRTFFVDIADAMDRIHPDLLRFIARGDRLAVYRRLLKMVLTLLARQGRNRSENQKLRTLRPVLQWSLRTLPPAERPNRPPTMDILFHQRNREFQSHMRSTLSGIRQELRSRTGYPTNLPVFAQLKHLTEKSIMGDPATRRRLIDLIDETQAQAARHRFG